MFDFVDNRDKCRKSCFFRQKIRSIFSPFWSILRPIWSILTLFNAKALFSALMSEFFTHFLSPSFKGFKDLCYPVCDYQYCLFQIFCDELFAKQAVPPPFEQSLLESLLNILSIKAVGTNTNTIQIKNTNRVQIDQKSLLRC